MQFSCTSVCWDLLNQYQKLLYMLLKHQSASSTEYQPPGATAGITIDSPMCVEIIYIIVIIFILFFADIKNLNCDCLMLYDFMLNREMFLT